MFLPRSFILLLAAALCIREGEAFNPSASGPFKVAHAFQESHRYQPRSVSFAEVGDLMDADEDDVFDDIDSPPAEDYLVNVGELEGEDSDEAGAEDDGQPPAWYTSRLRMEELRLKYRRHETDCGSPEFQIAGMSERINYLTGHMKLHPKDFSTRRGLVALVNKRRRLLNFLFKENVERYSELIKALGIRHKAPSRVNDRVEQYGRFPTQKAIKTHLVNKSGQRK